MLRHPLALNLILRRYYSSLSKPVFPDRKNPPGLNDRLKLWWAKEVTPDYHVAGRLTERQMKYASEGGFKSVLSLFTYDESGRFGGESGDYLPTTKESKNIVEDECGMQFAALLSPEEDWCSMDAVKKMVELMPSLDKPVLMHSNQGRSITFVLLMYLAQMSRQDLNLSQVDSSRIFNVASRMGLDFTDASSMDIIAQITGEPINKAPVKPDTDPTAWFSYWQCHPVYKNWYTAGQITRADMNVLESAGFKSVINMRLGVTSEGTPSQEEVNLLNIPERTGTYATENTKPRQFPTRLEETRIHPAKPKSYIEADCAENYESQNNAEFGDSVGYNADLELEAFETSKLKYCHYPTAATGPYEPYFEECLDEFLAAGSQGPVLVHCARAFRAAYAATLSAAIQHKKDLAWALEKSRDLGYGISQEETPDIFNVYKKYLAK